MGGVMLVDRKGRKFLLSLGSGGIIASLVCTGSVVPAGRKAGAWMPKWRCKRWFATDQTASLVYDKAVDGQAARAEGERRSHSLIVIYSYGDFRAATKVARSDDKAAAPIEITSEGCVPANKVVGVLLESIRESGRGAAGAAEESRMR